MKEIDIYSISFNDNCNDNSSEKVYLYNNNKVNLIKKLSLQSSSLEGKIHDEQNLPGQVQLEEEEVLSSSSSTEFDIETFRNKNKIQLNKFGLQSDEQTSDESPFLKFLGINFQINYLKERNKDPVLFLKCVFLSVFILDILNNIIFIVGLQFKILPMILSISLCTFVIVVVVHICQNSIKNGIKFRPIFLVSSPIIVLSFLAQFIYSLLVQTPFNSEPIFLLLTFLNCLVACFTFSMIFIPNSTPQDDLNYQQNFFAPRIMSAFFNAVGVVDALSDIVLGIKLIQGSSQKFLIIGIIFVVFSNIDYVYAAGKVFIPDKIGLKQQIVAIGVEVIVIALTLVVLVDVSKTSEDDTLFVILISIATTIVNFMHNLLLVNYYFTKSNLNSVEKIVTFVG